MYRYLLVIALAGCAAINSPEADGSDEVLHLTRAQMIAALRAVWERGYYEGWKRASVENGHGI